jgi:hypothetical protein
MNLNKSLLSSSIVSLEKIEEEHKDKSKIIKYDLNNDDSITSTQYTSNEPSQL